MLYGSLIEQHDFKASGKDPTGLGRWVSIVLKGGDGIKTRLVCGYNPCARSKKAVRSSYQQHRRYLIKKEKDTTCPRKRFKEGLLSQLTKWRKEEGHLIVCMDVNKDICRKNIGKALVKIDGLNMIEAVGNYTGQQLGATFFRGSK